MRETLTVSPNRVSDPCTDRCVTPCFPAGKSPGVRSATMSADRLAPSRCPPARGSDAGEPTVLPGVWDALSARLAVDAGFAGMFVSGFCVSGSLLAIPDVGLVTQAEMADVARRVLRGRSRIARRGRR